MIQTIAFVLLAAAPSTGIAARTCQPASLQIRVTDRAGAPITAVHVTVRGISDRQGTTNASGCVMFNNMRAGKYMLRAERDRFITLEKEFTVVPGRQTVVVAAMSPLEMRMTRTSAPADLRVLSIPDLAERQLIGREAVKQSPIGCTGASEARLIQVREPLTAHAHDDADEMLYVVAGEGTLKIGQDDRRVSPGWFSIIPRGTAHSIGRTGKNPVIVVSMLSGQPCAQTVAMAGSR